MELFCFWGAMVPLRLKIPRRQISSLSALLNHAGKRSSSTFHRPRKVTDGDSDAKANRTALLIIV
jgi:hypothetical protein